MELSVSAGQRNQDPVPLTCRGACLHQQHQGEQSHRLGVAGQRPVQPNGEPDRLSDQVSVNHFTTSWWSGSGREDQVQHVSDGVPALGWLGRVDGAEPGTVGAKCGLGRLIRWAASVDLPAHRVADQPSARLRWLAFLRPLLGGGEQGFLGCVLAVLQDRSPSQQRREDVWCFSPPHVPHLSGHTRQDSHPGRIAGRSSIVSPGHENAEAISSARSWVSTSITLSDDPTAAGWSGSR